MKLDWSDDQGRKVADTLIGRFVIEPHPDGARWFVIGGDFINTCKGDANVAFESARQEAQYHYDSVIQKIKEEG